ncbi:MAG: hypothetical protein JW852_10795 [Spirochaetales bacterium]|nr:hypothetical protein [Spirochaetales bacterium]
MIPSKDEAIAKVTEELKKEGFGVLTEIDVANPVESIAAIKNESLNEVAKTVKSKLKRVIENI